MNRWLYAASGALASQADTLSLACDSGFIWRSFYNSAGNPIACVKEILPGDELLLGYRNRGEVNVLARFRVGRPDGPISASSAFGMIPEIWTDEFRRHGYSEDPKLGALVGIFVEECEPLTGHLQYRNQNSVSRLDAALGETSPPAKRNTVLLSRPVSVFSPSPSSVAASTNLSGPPSDGIHVGIDVGGKPGKGFDLCITEWLGGVVNAVRWRRIPHVKPMPTTGLLRTLVRKGDMPALALATHVSAATTADLLWREVSQFGATGVHIDSPSAFSRNQSRHGRRCEKQSLTGVSFQSTPSMACDNEHGGDWGWLIYGMVAFAAVLHRGQLTQAEWMAALQEGTFARFQTAGMVLRECFPTATISVIRSRGRQAEVAAALTPQSALPEVQAVVHYLEHGVKAVKNPSQALFDRADALVAALGALPHVARGFREIPNWPANCHSWAGLPGDDQIEGSFICVV